MLQRSVPRLFKNTTHQTSSFSSKKSSVLSTKRLIHQGKMTSPFTTKAATPSKSSSSDDDARKPGVASNAEMRHFLEQNRDGNLSKIVIVDARNPDFSVEPSDALYGSVRGEFPIADCGTEKRPNARNVPFDRTKKRSSGANNAEDILRTLEKERARITTHCGGGGRGQKSKEWLEKEEGFTNVVNGGGPRVKELSGRCLATCETVFLNER